MRVTDPSLTFCLGRIGKSRAGWGTLVVRGPADAAKSAGELRADAGSMAGSH